MAAIEQFSLRHLGSAFAAGLLTLLALSGFRVAAQDDLAKELPRLKPLEPEAAQKSFHVHAGFHLEPVAVEPLVTDPVSACYDADGRLYVVEMRGYPYPEKTPSGGVARLEDRDGDGRFETRTQFLDGLSWLTSVVPYDDGVFIAVAPDIIYAKDTNGDGIADIRKVMFTGFGTENVQGLLNGLLWGPDGWIYGAGSINVGMVRNLCRPSAAAVSLRGRDFRFKADGSAFEAISGGGQFGHSFDDWGHRFSCNNSNHVRQIVLPSRYLERDPALNSPPAILDIAVEGAAAPVYRISPPEPWRVVRTRQRAADPAMVKRLPPTELFATGFFTSATGITIYRGSAYPPEYRGNVFVGDVGGNLVHRKILTVDGAIYRATRADSGCEFLASTDNWFRPVNFANTPGGTLLILDMYRETIEHPASIPEPIKKHLDLTSGKDRGRLYELLSSGTRRRLKPKLSKAQSSELVEVLADPDGWWRETAQRLLIERHDRSTVELLRKMVKARPTALARLHALWTLESLESLDPDSLALGLADPEPRIREQAARLSELLIKDDLTVRSLVMALATDADPMVRFQVAFSLGVVNHDPAAIAALAALAARDAQSPWVRTAVLSSLAGRAVALFQALTKKAGFLETSAGQVWLDELAYLIGTDRTPRVVDEFLGRLGGSGLAPDKLMRVVLSVARGRRRAGMPFQTLLDGPAAGKIRDLLAEAARLVDSAGSVDSRLVAIRLLGLGAAETARKSFPDLLDARQPAAVQLAALQALSECFEPAVAARIVAHWKSMSPSVRREAIEVLFSRSAGIAAVLDSIESRQISSAEIDPARWSQLQNHPDRKLRDRARIILGARPATSGDRESRIAAYRPSLALLGRREQGREVFAKVCATCHKVEGRGIEVGPDLATVSNRTPEDLLVRILDPNREVAPNYINYNVATSDGRVMSGMIAEETATTVVLKRAEGAFDRVPRDQIDSIASTGVSLMPEGLEKGLSAQDLADLMAFVLSIKPATPSIPAVPAVR
jgi:putative membrane-bound dehydrogenase-like protein